MSPRPRTAHPRSRGENCTRTGKASQMEGSSPLTRGKPGTAACISAMLGLIPAHAGKTRSISHDSPPSAAHPRSRGENEALAASDATDKGSSPLTRGKRRAVYPADSRAGLIPAHAGKTTKRWRCCGQPGAHPRSRGENQIQVLKAHLGDGSSPLTRGKRFRAFAKIKAIRLIPAHAGKTWSPPALTTVIWAHPRSRGENFCVLCVPCCTSGSSPLTRGKPTNNFIYTQSWGLIPAHAGKTVLTRAVSAVLGAHPRSRGENHMCPASHNPQPGSSPLTRGKPTWARMLFSPRGLIPAHAGKTSCPMQGIH